MKKNILKAGYINARSIIPSHDTIAEIIHESKFDLYGISETWLNDAFPSEMLHIDGYELVRKDRSPRGGVVCCYLRNTVGWKLIVTVLAETVHLEQLYIGRQMHLWIP